MIGDDDYEYNIDKIVMVTIENSFGQRFMFKPNEMKSIELINIIDEFDGNVL